MSNKPSDNIDPVADSVDLNERSLLLLKTLVQNYVSSGQPVGSKALAKESGLDLSPATIRNILADLERYQLIKSPHTSAGRVPTDKGYRLFVDNLISVKPIKKPLVEKLRNELKIDANPQELVTSASGALSHITQMASIVMLPRREHKRLRQIEFLPLSDNRVLAILVTQDAEVENRIFRLKQAPNQDELRKAANFLNASFAGRDIHHVRKHLLSELNQARQDVSDFMDSVLEMAEQVFPERSEGSYMVTGQSHLLGIDEMSSMEKVRQLFEVFNHKQSILELLDQCLLSQNAQVFIGAESGYAALDLCSIVTAPYSIDGNVVGVLGIVGPTRMPYDRVIPVVDITARLLGSALQFKS